MGSDVTYPIIAPTRARTRVRGNGENPSLPFTPSLLVGPTAEPTCYNTHTKLTALLTDTVAPAIAEHGGRIVKNTGDGFLTEFPSPFRDGAQRRPLRLPLLPL